MTLKNTKKKDWSTERCNFKLLQRSGRKIQDVGGFGGWVCPLIVAKVGSFPRKKKKNKKWTRRWRNVGARANAGGTERGGGGGDSQNGKGCRAKGIQDK